MIKKWWLFSERLACLQRPAWRRQGGGALFFQGLNLREAFSAQAKLRPTDGGGKDPREAKSF